MTAKMVRQQFADTMLELGRADPKLVVLVGDISHFALQPMAKACPERYYNVGICEPTIVSMAAGLAKAGFHVVAHTIAPFLIERSFEQIKLDFGYQKLGGNLVTVGGAFDYSNLGCTHHCYDDWALLKSVPGAQVVYPGSALEFDVLFREVYTSPCVTLYRLPQVAHGHEWRTGDIRFGKAVRVTEGRGLTLVVTGPHLRDALDVREGLAGMGLEPEIVYVHTVWPLDTDLLRESLRKTRRVLVLEEHSRVGGVGEDVLHLAHEIGGVAFRWLGIPSDFIRGYRSYEEHCEALGLSREGILREARGFTAAQAVRTS